MRLNAKIRQLGLVAAVIFALTGLAAAQMEDGDRGILPIESEGLLEVGGIKVDVSGRSDEDARYNGWRIAQREGFAKLWAQTNKRSEKDAPRLSDATLDSLVSAVVVENEQIGSNRYIATLGVLFDRARVGQLVGLSATQRRSAPMLLIPVTVTGGTEFSVERKNDWQRAWAQFRTSQSPIDYVRASGLGPDPLLVGAAATRRPSIDWWRSVADFYGAANILVAEVTVHRSFPGGPATARFVARMGIDREALGSFSLTAPDSEGIPAMMREGARRMDDIYAKAFRDGDLNADRRFIVRYRPSEVEDDVNALVAAPYQIQIQTPNAAAYNGAIASLRGIPGVEGVNELSLSLGGNSSVIISFKGDLDTLRSAIVGRGWQVDYSGGLLRMVRPVPVQPAQPSLDLPTVSTPSQPTIGRRSE